MQELKQYKKILVPLLVFLFVLGASLAGMILLLQRVFATKESYEQTLSERLVLQDRANTLQEANAKLDDDTTQKLALALPAEGTALYVAAQLRSLANQKSVVTESIMIDSPISSGTDAVSQVFVNFGLKGSYENVSSFLDELIVSLPVINFDNIELAQNNDEVEGMVRLIAYAAPYPQSLPAITNPLTGISPSQQQVVDQVKGFKEPTISHADEVVPLENPNRRNPFSSQDNIQNEVVTPIPSASPSPSPTPEEEQEQ